MAMEGEQKPLGQVPPGATLSRPQLTTNEVLQIAQKALASAQLGVQGYFGETPLYQQRASNRAWIVCFTRRPPVPDDEIFVIVDDVTRRTEIWFP